VEPVAGPIRLRVAYPSATDRVDAGDSTFIFGTAGTGDATLRVNGTPVAVAPNGAWLAWVPIPSDSVINFHIEASTATDSALLVHPVSRTRRFRPPSAPVWVDSLSFSPGGQAWWPAGEYLPISVRASEGATVRLVLPNGTIVPLASASDPDAIPWGIRAFDRDTANLHVTPRAERYTGVLRGVAVGDQQVPILGPAAAQGIGESAARREPTSRTAPRTPVVEAILGSDTARAAWPLSIRLLDTMAAVVQFDDDTARLGDTDSLTVGRARPGGTYHWFFPTGTRTVATGRLGDDLRVRLSRGQEAWVAVADAQLLPAGTPALRSTVGSITLTPADDRFLLRIPLGARIPFRVEEEPSRLTLRLYQAVSDINWTRFGVTDPYLRDIRWLQAADDEVTITLDLAGPLWGYRTRWSRSDLILELRRPPVVDPERPLSGRRILVDAGHPPAGALGPTGLREAEANLAVALQLQVMLQEAGAEVLMSRVADVPLDLLPRVRLADSAGAEVLVSIHNNALPDGVNPFSNSGSSVFYNHPRSLPLARAIQRQLVRRLGLRDLGVGRGDLALVRPTWMPAVLTEGLFMMVPDQEAALRSGTGQRRYALAIRDGIAEWLRDVAGGTAPSVP
jgi:N-acetylmuramoyl-L-alanine amidase